MASYYAQQKYKCTNWKWWTKKDCHCIWGCQQHELPSLVPVLFWVSNSIPIVWLTRGFQKLKGILKKRFVSRRRLIQIVSLSWGHYFTLTDDFRLSTHATATPLSLFCRCLAVQITDQDHVLLIDDQWLESSASYLLLIRKVFSSLRLHIASHRHVGPRWRSMFVCLARWRQF